MKQNVSKLGTSISNMDFDIIEGEIRKLHFDYFVN